MSAACVSLEGDAGFGDAVLTEDHSDFAWRSAWRGSIPKPVHKTETTCCSIPRWLTSSASGSSSWTCVPVSYASRVSRLNLPDQPLQILTALLEQPGALVTRDELRQRLWPSDTFVDFEHGLNAAVKRLRDVLGDSADTPRFVETVPKRGYRFVASVQRNDAASTDGASVGLAPVVARAPAPDTYPRRRWLVSALALLVGLAGLGGWWWHGVAARAATSLRPAAPSPPHVVHLTTLGGFADGAAFPQTAAR